MTMGAFRSRDGKAPIFVRIALGRWKFFLLSLCGTVFYQLKHLVFAVHAELLIDVRDVPMARPSDSGGRAFLCT